MIADANESVTHLWAPLVALLAGFVSFASPCVLPLVPGYLSFVTGEAVTDEGRGRWHRLAPILLFVAGFTVMFTLYGAFASTFVHLVKDRRGQIIAGVVIVVLGVLLVGYALGRGSIRLYAERRPFLERVHPGTAGALPLGMAFAAGWTPCVGPVLGAILGLAAVGSSRWGAFLLLCYSLGLGIPFVALGLGVEWLAGSARWIQRHYRAIAVASGSILVVVGVLVATGEFTRRLAPLIRYGPLL
ncbi:MAG TPA: cytochrome c biogenesis protein CcdA [Actinomycetota bacterium]|nr:cytochrome c biogenesis protein CcdA [Actinomycetota bacterium]